jgi:predicted AlkP superfamily phosphohydrolase/phosphomutase
VDMKKGNGKKANRVIVVGLDGGTYAVFRPLIDSGKLPTLAAMMEGGAWGELSSTIPPHTAPAWVSFITGKNPGKHGIFQFGPIDHTLYEGGWRRIVNSKTISGQTLWDIIGRGGKKVGVINVPLTYPPKPVNGFMVTGMLTPRGADHFTYPPHLGSTLENYKIDVTVGEGEYGALGGLNTEDPDVLAGLIEELNTLVDLRTEAAIRLMKMYSPDFFIIFFTETDRLQHIFWPYLRTKHSPLKEKSGLELHVALEDFYRNLDNNLGQLMKIAGEDSIRILMSDHGFGPAAEKDVNFNVWLEDRGFLKLQRDLQSALNPRRLLKRLRVSSEIVYSLMSSLLPSKMVRKLQRTWGKVVSSPIDWSQTKAVFIPIFDFVGGIQIILNGDTHQLSGQQLTIYSELRDNLIQQLHELKDPQTDRPIVRQVYKREELYEGVHTVHAPDIIFVMAPEYRGDKGLVTRSLVTAKPKNISLWTGTHRREGIVMLCGPDITPGRLTSTPQIQDLTPTILYLLGIGIPEDMDGQVIEEAINTSYLSQHEVKYTKPLTPSTEDSEAETVGFTEEEMEQVKRQLESLGYIS